MTINKSFNRFYQCLQQADDYYIEKKIDDRIYLANDDETVCYVFDLSLGKYQKVPYKEYKLLSEDIK